MQVLAFQKDWLEQSIIRHTINWICLFFMLSLTVASVGASVSHHVVATSHYWQVSERSEAYNLQRKAKTVLSMRKSSESVLTCKKRYFPAFFRQWTASASRPRWNFTVERCLFTKLLICVICRDLLSLDEGSTRGWKKRELKHSASNLKHWLVSSFSYWTDTQFLQKITEGHVIILSQSKRTQPH